MRRIRRLSWLAGLLTISVISACDDGGKSPFAPTGPSTALPATIQGVVKNSAASKSPPISSAFRTATGAIGMTVTVVGMNLGAVADSEGRFALTGVPAGPVQLRFTGAGVNAVLDLESIAPGETLNIVVSVAGSSAVLEATSSNLDDPSEVDNADEPDDDTEDDDADDADEPDDDNDDDAAGTDDD